MFHNPVNDFLYLPEYSSRGKGKITIYDSDGNYKGLLKPDISLRHMDRVWKIAFFKDGSYFIMTKERVGWKPVGKFFMTQNEILVRYFNPDGKLISDIAKSTNIEELSHAVRYGGPRILFKPSFFVRLTPDEHIAVSKSDNNELSIYDIRGKKIRTITLDIPREKLSDEEFQKAKKELIKAYENDADSRMYYLAKNMIKLEFKSIYWSQILTSKYIILLRIVDYDEFGYPRKTKLIFFNWEGEKKGEKVIEGFVMNVKNDRIFIKYYDDEGDEYFRIEPAVFDFEKNSKQKQKSK
jgi:hypothetical protein